jgi:hypothetical protein
MGAKLSSKYDREAGILHIDKCPPYPEQESEELGNEVIARLNPKTGAIEKSRGALLLNSAALQRSVRVAGLSGPARLHRRLDNRRAVG